MEVHVCSSDKEAFQLIETVENSEGVRFVTRKSKNSRLTYVDDLKHFRILFEDVGRQSIPVLFDGIPFIVLGTDVRECQFGYQRPKRKTITDGDHCDLKHEQYIQNSKKISCKANVKLRRILKFPEYKIEGPDGRYKRKKIYQKIRERFCALTKQEYVVLVQFDGKHSDHVIGKDAGYINTLDRRITDKIKSLTKEGMLNVTDVANRVKEFAREIAPEADMFNRRYCPSRKDVYNHIAYSLSHPRHHRDTQAAGEPLLQNSIVSMSKSTHLDNVGIVPYNDNTSRENAINHTVAEDISPKQQVMLTPIKQENDDAAQYYDANLYGSHLGLTTVNETAAIIPPNPHVDSSTANHVLVANNNWNSHAPSMLPSSGNLIFMTPNNGATSSQLFLAHPGIQLWQPVVLLINAPQVDLHRHQSDTRAAVEPLLQNSMVSMSKSTHSDNFGIIPNNDNTSRENAINHTVAEDIRSKQQIIPTPIKQENVDDANLYGSHLGLTTVDETAALIPPNLCVDSHNDNHVSVVHSNLNSDASSKLPASGNLNFLTPHNGATSSQPSPAHPGMQGEQPAVLLINGFQVDSHSTMGKTHAEKQKAHKERKKARRIRLPAERIGKGKAILQAIGPQNQKTRRRRIRDCIGKKRTQLKQPLLCSQI